MWGERARRCYDNRLWSCCSSSILSTFRNAVGTWLSFSFFIVAVVTTLLPLFLKHLTLLSIHYSIWNLDPFNRSWEIPPPAGGSSSSLLPKHHHSSWCVTGIPATAPARVTTPVGDGVVGAMASPFHVACPIHSPFRFRMPQMNGDEYYPHHHVFGQQVPSFFDFGVE